MAAETSVAEPRLERPVTLHFAGDWGQANLHRVCGWLAQELGDRAPSGSRFAIWSARGGTDSVRAVGRGEVDVALTTPAAFAAAALDGRGRYAGEPFPQLRALGSVPQNDRLVLAVDADLDVASFADLRARRVPLRIATSPDDGVNHIGQAVQEIMSRAGIPRAALESWGGGYVEFERPNACIDVMRAGQANAVFQEAIMTPWWQGLAEQRPLRFLPIESSVLDSLEADYSWPRGTLPAGYLRGLDTTLETLDFSDFLLLVRAEMSEDVAYVLAWCLGETRSVLERQYAHLPPDRSPVSYPLVPARMAQTPVPLHAGAERYYREFGHL